MTTTTVTVDVAGAMARLRETIAATRDMTPVFGGPINASVDTLFRRQFESEGSYAGARWAPLRPVTKQLRTRRGHGRGGILRDTNRLWASFTKLGLGPEAVKVVTSESLERGSTVPHARFHQTGFVSRTFVVIDADGNPIPLRRKRPQGVPARPIVPDRVPPALVKAWETFIARWIEGRAA